MLAPVMPTGIALHRQSDKSTQTGGITATSTQDPGRNGTIRNCDDIVYQGPSPNESESCRILGDERGQWAESSDGMANPLSAKGNNVGTNDTGLSPG